MAFIPAFFLWPRWGPMGAKPGIGAGLPQVSLRRSRSVPPSGIILRYQTFRRCQAVSASQQLVQGIKSHLRREGITYR
jgi:hypothetical protein